MWKHEAIMRKVEDNNKITQNLEKRRFVHKIQVGETGVGWGKFWLGQCPSVPNELPDGETNYVFGEQGTTAFTGSTRIIDAHFTSEISPKITF